MLVLICWKCSWLMNDFNQDLKSRGALLDAGDHWKPKTRHYYMRILFYWMIFLWLVKKKKSRINQWEYFFQAATVKSEFKRQKRYIASDIKTQWCHYWRVPR